LKKRRKELDTLRLQLDLDRSKFQNHKERLYNQQSSALQDTTPSTRVIITQPPPSSIQQQRQQQQSIANDVDENSERSTADAQDCANALHSSSPCARRALPSPAWSPPLMHAMLTDRRAPRSCNAFFFLALCHFFFFEMTSVFDVLTHYLVNILIATFEFSGGPKRVGGIGTAYTQVIFIGYKMKIQDLLKSFFARAHLS
jgi:hypothetical protein